MKAANIITLGFCLCASVLGVAIICWAMIRTGYFASPVKTTLYLLIPGAVAVAGILLMNASFSLRVLCCLCGAAIGSALILHEIYAQRAAARIAPTTEQAGVKEGHRENWPEAVYPSICGQMLLEDRDDGTVVSMVEDNDAGLLPLAGPSNRLIRSPAKRGADRAAKRSDEFGFNNPPGEWAVVPINYLAVGDSFTYGADVPFGRGMVDVIRAREGRTVNLGCGGNGPLMNLASLHEFGPQLRPKVVLWFHYEGNDLTKDIVRERRVALLMRYLEPSFSQNLVGRRSNIDLAIINFLKLSQTPKSSSRTIKSTASPSIVWKSVFNLSGLRGALGMNIEFSQENLELFRRILRNARDTVSSWNGRLVLVYLPNKVRFSSVFARWDAAGYEAEVVETARDEGIEVINLVPVFKASENPEGLFQGHYTEEGYRLVANSVLSALASRQKPTLR